MPATFWTGSNLSFTNGSKTVTVNSGSPLTSVRPNSSLTTSNYNEPVEVESAVGSTITLYSPWPGSTGTFAATITPSAATVAAAGQAAQEVVQEIKALIGSASVNVSANNFVKRDANGRIKTATPEGDEDAVNKGHLSNIVSGIKESFPVTKPSSAEAFVDGVLFGGFGARSTGGVTDWNDASNARAGNGYTLLRGDHENGNGDSEFFHPFCFEYLSKDGTGNLSQLGFGYKFADIIMRTRYNGWTDWVRFYNDRNLNISTFGGAANKSEFHGHNASSVTSILFQSLNSTESPTSITVEGTWSLIGGNGATIRTGITAENIAMTSRAGSRLLRIFVDGSTGLTANEPVELRAESSSSKITVNF